MKLSINHLSSKYVEQWLPDKYPICSDPKFWKTYSTDYGQEGLGYLNYWLKDGLYGLPFLEILK